MEQENRGRILLVVNPISGGEKADRTRRLVQKLSADSMDLTVVETERSGDARRAAASMPPDTSIIVAAGGDGTVNEVVGGMRDRRVAVGIIPLGTANLVAREFRIPVDIEAACDLVLKGRRRPIDLGRTEDGCFLAVAGAGFDAAVVHRMAESRNGNIKTSSYLEPMIEMIASYPFPRISVEADGAQVTEEATDVIVANTRSYGGPFILAPDAKPDDGLFDVCIFNSPNIGAYAAYMAAAVMQSHDLLPSTTVLRARTVRCVSSGDVPVQLDGDPHGRLPVTFQIEAGAVQLIVP